MAQLPEGSMFTPIGQTMTWKPQLKVRISRGFDIVSVALAAQRPCRAN